MPAETPSTRRTLYKLMRSDPAAVVADPLWRQLRSENPHFLTRTPPTFRLALLRHQFAQHADDPWALLRSTANDELEWPTCKLPLWELGYATNPDEDGGIVSARIQLAGGWAFSFWASAADVQYEMVEGPDPDEPETFSLDRVLTLLFSNPKADPRDSLSDEDAQLSPCGGGDMYFQGIRLYAPMGRDPEEDYDHVESGNIADEVLVASLSEDGGLYRRPVDKNEQPRPLFAKEPVARDSRNNEGCLTCTWDTDYYVPVDADDAATPLVWQYEKLRLASTEELIGSSAYDLAELAWEYKTMGDLNAVIAGKLAAPAAHKFFLPIYEALLFGN